MPLFPTQVTFLSALTLPCHVPLLPTLKTVGGGAVQRQLVSLSAFAVHFGLPKVNRVLAMYA